MPNATIVGWDLGGAHLKAALAKNSRLQDVIQLPCPLWQGLDHLEQAVEQILQTWPDAQTHRITMTGELVDLFSDRASGVSALFEAMSNYLRRQSVAVYAGRHGLLKPSAAARYCNQIASANWLASSHFAAARISQGLLIDIGSTTTDIIAFDEGQVLGTSLTDGDRLSSDELVYSGAVRTPVCAVTRRAPFAGQWQTLAAELFATMSDVYRVLGQLPESADLLPTADGRGKTQAESRARLARMLGRDASAASIAAWRQVAKYIARRQYETLLDALQRIQSRYPHLMDAPVIGAGCGRFIAQRIAELDARSFHDFGALCGVSGELAQAAADCAPAAALALLDMSDVDR